MVSVPKRPRHLADAEPCAGVEELRLAQIALRHGLERQQHLFGIRLGEVERHEVEGLEDPLFLELDQQFGRAAVERGEGNPSIPLRGRHAIDVVGVVERELAAHAESDPGQPVEPQVCCGAGSQRPA